MKGVHTRRIIILLLILAFTFCGCGQKETYESVYNAYIELALEDAPGAQREYVYFRNQELENLAFEGSWELYSCEILEWEQLSDRLWVAYVVFQTNYEPDPYKAINFVGLIDGKYWVIPGIAGLPDDLKEGVDFSQFDAYSSGITPEDVL